MYVGALPFATTMYPPPHPPGLFYHSSTEEGGGHSDSDRTLQYTHICTCSQVKYMYKYIHTRMYVHVCRLKSSIYCGVLHTYLWHSCNGSMCLYNNKFHDNIIRDYTFLSPPSYTETRSFSRMYIHIQHCLLQGM